MSAEAAQGAVMAPDAMPLLVTLASLPAGQDLFSR
jgi:hypothetical protein